MNQNKVILFHPEQEKLKREIQQLEIEKQALEEEQRVLSNKKSEKEQAKENLFQKIEINRQKMIENEIAIEQLDTNWVFRGFDSFTNWYLQKKETDSTIHFALKIIEKSLLLVGASMLVTPLVIMTAFTASMFSILVGTTAVAAASMIIAAMTKPARRTKKLEKRNKLWKDNYEMKLQQNQDYETATKMIEEKKQIDEKLRKVNFSIHLATETLVDKKEQFDLLVTPIEPQKNVAQQVSTPQKRK